MKHKTTQPGDAAALPIAHDADAASVLPAETGTNTGRKQAEAALREAEWQLRAVLSSVPITIFATDGQGVFTLSEGTGLERVGLKPGENIGVSAVDLYGSLSFVEHTGKVTAGSDVIRRALAGETVTATSEVRGVSFDNRIGPLRDADGQVVGLVGVAIDVTERKQAEAALRESQQLIEGILNAIPTRVFWKDMNLVYLGCNAAFARDAGLPDPKDIIGKDDYQMVWRDQAESYRDDDRRVIESGRARVLIEEPQTTPAGNTITLLTSKVPLRSSEGEVCGVIGTYADITERKQTEDELRESEERFRTVFEKGSFGVVVTTVSEGRFTEANAAFCQMLGYTAEELKRLTFVDVTHPDDRTRDVEGVKRLWAGQIPHYKTEKRYLKKNGDTAWGALAVSLIRSADGTPLYSLAMIEDITERKRAEAEQATLEAQLQQARKMESVGRLAGGVAHDFNNMLGVILGHAELALEQVDPAQPLHADLTEIRKAAVRSADLTRQLLAFARKQTIEPRVLNLNETVAGMLTMLHRLIGENIDVKWQPAADLWPVNVDPSQIDQILVNLCLNARDAIDGVGTLTIETGNRTFDERHCGAIDGCTPGDFVLLTVRDNGCGMDKDTLSHLFEPFFTTKVLGKGVGLGLATVYGSVKQNNGFITVDSQPNLGTTFKIHLPRHVAKAGQARAEDAGRPVPEGHETILLVEDEPAILTLAKRMLELQGYTVLAANTPGEALRLAREHPGEIHLLMTDVVMPEMNGRVLARNLLSVHPLVKRLFMSGYTADVIAHQGVLDEGVHFIQKPFTRQDLATKVRDALDARS